ncbi:DUF6660 family protein [Pedobacter rhizosphaerae]|uniref:DUF6660 family protein n=1 Tax=Pedobacter rhizosphaerae TaxID=390241 RepID=UPI000B8A5EEA|nr:DUF6660 family protein [Pedobacter rhizosphaerae]
MKHIILLFSFYLILLGIVPCQDKEDMVSIQQYTASIQTEHADANHFHEESCPPFCSCACCSVGQYFPVENTTVSIVAVVQKPYPGFRLSDLKRQPTNIWQPPKLV